MWFGYYGCAFLICLLLVCLEFDFGVDVVYWLLFVMECLSVALYFAYDCCVDYMSGSCCLIEVCCLFSLVFSLFAAGFDNGVAC